MKEWRRFLSHLPKESPVVVEGGSRQWPLESVQALSRPPPLISGVSWVVLLRLGRERRALVVPRFFLGEKYLRPEPVNPLSNGLAAEAGAGDWWGSDIPSRKQFCLPWAQGTRPPVKLPQMSIARENEELHLITVEKGEPHADRRWGEQEHGKMGLTCLLRVAASEPPGNPPIKDVPAAGSSRAGIFPCLKIHNPLKTIKTLCPVCIL